jgi:DNA-binding cell septation regulator SpoVG
MTQKIQIRRGDDATRQTVTFDSGELIWAVDTQKLWVGDGLTAGGIEVTMDADLADILDGTTGFTELNVDDINVDGQTISTEADNKDINLEPHGTGKVATSKQISSSVTEGTSPIIVTSSTKIDNLNADKIDGADLSTDGTFASNSDVLIPSQQAVKEYIDLILNGSTAFSLLNAGNIRIEGQEIYSVHADERVQFQCENVTIANSVNDCQLQAYATGGAAFISLHRPSSYAVNFGLDTDNVLKVGGWSMGTNAYAIWHAGNQGPGTGLNADLLDGQHGTYYATASSVVNLLDGTTGFTELNVDDINVNGQTISTAADNKNIIISPHGTGVLEVTKAVEATANGVPAISSASFGQLQFEAISTDNTPVGYGFHRAGNFAIALYNHASDAFNLRKIDSAGNDALLWDSQNDGAGSGLDADLLDGQHGTYYAIASELDTAEAETASIKNNLIQKAKAEIIQAVLDLSDEDDYSDIKLFHLFDNESGSSMTDKLSTGNDLTLSSASSSSTSDLQGLLKYDTFDSDRSWQAADDDSLSFGNGTTDDDLTILVAGIPTQFVNDDAYFLGKWDVQASTGPIEYGLAIGQGTALKSFYFVKGDNTNRGYILKRTSANRGADAGTFKIYCGTATGQAYSGMDLYIDGQKQTSVIDGSQGTYTAMSNTSAVVGNFYRNNGTITTTSISDFKYSVALVMAKKLTDKEVKKLSTLLMGIANQTL